MICSSVKRLRFIRPYPSRSDSTFKWLHFRGARHEQEAIEAEYAQADEYPDEADTRLGEIEQAILALEERPLAFGPADMARAGAFVSLASDGTLQVERGFVLPEDMPTKSEEVDDTSGVDGYDHAAYDGRDDRIAEDSGDVGGQGNRR